MWSRKWSVIAAIGLSLMAGCADNNRSADDTTLLETVEGLGPSPYGDDGRLNPDGRRVRDIVALQGSLLRYRLDRGRFPDQLAELLPGFAPPDGQIPRDPVSGDPYAYRSTGSGSDYEIGATLSNGRNFPGVGHKTAEQAR